MYCEKCKESKSMKYIPVYQIAEDIFILMFSRYPEMPANWLVSKAKIEEISKKVEICFDCWKEMFE